MEQNELDVVRAILRKHNVPEGDIPDVSVGTPLYEDLFDYYCGTGEMPYGTMKARTGDPDQWIIDRLCDIGA